MDTFGHHPAAAQTLLPPVEDPGDFVPFPQMFQGLSDSALLELTAQFQRIQVTSGETLIKQGEPGDCMYVLVNGRLRAYVERADGLETVVGEVGRGEVVGEMALLIDESRSATIRAIRDSELLRLSKEVFDRFIEKYPLALKQIARVSLMRLRRSILSPRVESTVTTIAIAPAGRDAPLSHFAESLARALGAFAPTLHLNKDRFERGLADASERMATTRSRVSVSAWLNEQESKYRYVVYESDTTPSQWTRRCVRQADHVLAVGLAGSSPALGENEAAMQPADRRGAPRRDLVLLHPPHTARPSGTEAWLAARDVDGHHHVRIGCEADYDRIARFLTGRAVGLVLGGGGARGLAHIGAIRAIQELGIPIDLIGGTSCGALIAGAMANGLDYDHMLQSARERMAASGSLLDFTLPFVSLVSGRKITRSLQWLLEDVTIEDLWLNYFCVSTNLSRGGMMVHRRGLLWKAIRASVSLPGILPPVLQDRDLLVDGGLMNKLPVDVMRGLCNGGQVLAVSVSMAGGLHVDHVFGEHLSGWGVLCRRLNPFSSSRNEPNIASILLCSTLVKSTHTQESLEREADVCVRVPLVPIGLFDFQALDAIVDAGYRAALAQLKGWSASKPGAWGVRRTADASDASGLTALSEALHPTV